MSDCILILDNLRSVENVGSIFRTADGFGVSQIVLVGTTPSPIDRFGRKRPDLAKVALGAEETIPWTHTDDAVSALVGFKQGGYQIVSLEQDARSTPLRSLELGEKFVLIVGSETDGVDPKLLDLSDAIVEIDMAGMKESLNVSVATGVALFHLIK